MYNAINNCSFVITYRHYLQSTFPSDECTKTLEHFTLDFTLGMFVLGAFGFGDYCVDVDQQLYPSWSI